MANLIVTVIAIALVAVASLMGAYYGGSAFLKGSAKAAASALVNQGQQIAAGWVLFANDRGGVAPTNIDPALVDNNYITERPVPPSSALAGTSWTLKDGADSTDVNVLPVFAEIQIGAKTVCDEVQRSARNIVHTDPYVSTATALARKAMFDNSRFDCLVGPVTDNFTVVYKIQ
ncbi:MAG TPA: hypothetical protein DCW68_05290 [Rhodospirillaceae bacterium]|nr:MAG: hypothetical protein A2018_02360 [Alphaproteobacteria bacterium GWF2_58_20]HAU29509.1 hypothetical protein [Rhodospirillaceae bacterium]